MNINNFNNTESILLVEDIAATSNAVNENIKKNNYAAVCYYAQKNIGNFSRYLELINNQKLNNSQQNIVKISSNKSNIINELPNNDKLKIINLIN